MKLNSWYLLPAHAKRAMEVAEVAGFGCYLLDNTPNFYFNGLEFDLSMRYTKEVREPQHGEFLLKLDEAMPLDETHPDGKETLDEVKDRISKHKKHVRKDFNGFEDMDSAAFSMLERADRSFHMTAIQIQNAINLAEAIRAMDRNAKKITANHIAEAIQYARTPE